MAPSLRYVRALLARHIFVGHELVTAANAFHAKARSPMWEHIQAETIPIEVETVPHAEAVYSDDQSDLQRDMDMENVSQAESVISGGAARTSFWDEEDSTQAEQGEQALMAERSGGGAAEDPAQVESGGIRLKVVYVNVNTSLARKDCIEAQFEARREKVLAAGFKLTIERFPAVVFQTCTDPDSCVAELPECFPSGETAIFTDTHIGNTADDQNNQIRVLRGVLGNYCSHMKIMKAFQAVQSDYDYLMVLEDDTIFKETFFDELAAFINGYDKFWTLIAIDTFTTPEMPLPQEDFIGPKVYSISGRINMYWGAHTWLLNPMYMEKLVKFYQKMPAMAVDWIPLAKHPLHLTMWAFQPNAVKQRSRLLDHETDWLIPQCMAENIQNSDIQFGGSETKPGVAMTTFVHGEQQPTVFKRGKKATKRFSATGTASRSSNLPIPAAPRRGRDVVLLGMHGAGLRTVSRLLAPRFSMPGVIADTDIFNCSFGHGNINSGFCSDVWMHTHPERFTEFADCVDGSCANSRLSEKVAVAVVRHPFTQMARMMLGDVHYLQCPTDTRMAPVLNPCTFGMPPGDTSRLPAIPRAACRLAEAPGGVCWTSAVQSWNSHAHGYTVLRGMGIFHAVLVVRFEDVLQHPDAIAEMIATAADLELAPPGKAGEMIVPGMKALIGKLRAKLKTVPEDSRFDCEELVSICQQLNNSQLTSLGYHGCQWAWPGYDYLIHRRNITEGNLNAALNAMRTWGAQPECWKTPEVPWLTSDGMISINYSYTGPEPVLMPSHYRPTSLYGE